GFLSNHIDEATLPELSDNDLRELGVSSLGHRKKILAAIARLHGQPSVEASQLTDAPLAAEERRPVTVLFADLCGFTQLSEHVDDEALRSIVASFLAMAESSILRCGGVVDKTIGDAVMAVFGVPVAHDDDVANAARAALAIMAGMAGVSRSCGRELNAHVGLATGEAILTHSLGARTVLGASVNVASRVASAAVAGEILVTDTIARTLRDHFALEERAAFIAKGISEPVKVWLLRSEQASSSQAQLFIGRRTELGQLNAVLEGCRSDGRGVIIHIRGEPGIYMTRLVAEAAAKAERDGLEVVATHALDFGWGHEGQPLRRLVAQLLQFPPNFGQAERASALAQLSHQLGIAPGVSPFLFELADALMDDGLRALFQAVPESSRAHARRTAVLAVVAARARRGPLLVIVEDAHWADEELIEMLSAAGELTGAHPPAVITTARPGGGRAPDALRGSPHG
ncbi:adenylate/guanylate cyclase domain-containing protein, partial [Nostoc sp. NIES-2111]